MFILWLWRRLAGMVGPALLSLAVQSTLTPRHPHRKL